MATAGDAYDLTTFANAFKRAFIDDDKVDIFHFDNPLLKRVPVVDGFVGSDEERVRATSFMGGYGYGSLPRPNESNLIRPRVSAKKFYVRAMLDTESIAAAMRSEGAFFELVDRTKVDINRAIQNGLSLALCQSNADNELVLGIIATSGVSGSNPYTLTLTSMHDKLFHVKQVVTIQDADTDLFEVTAVDADNSQITVSRLTGTQVPAATDEIMLQGGDGSAFSGLKGAVAASGTLYNVTIADGWKARATAMASAGITEHDLYNELLKVKCECGEQPDLIACGLTQYLKIAEMLSNKRVLNDLSDEMGHSGLSLVSDEGNVEIVWDRHIENDRIYFLNTKRMMLRRRPLSGMVEHGGDLLLPDYINDQDRFHMVYRLYGDFYIEPTCIAVLTGLSTA